MIALESRVTSAFPLSIGTSLAFESLSQSGGTPYDPDRVIPQQVDLNTYGQFWINLSTLFRNLYNAVGSQDAEKLRAADCVEVLWAEIDTIESICQDETQTKLQTYYYTSAYQDLKGLSSIAKIRLPRTDKQLFYYRLHDAVIQPLASSLKKVNSRVRQFKRDLKPDHSLKALIFTHQAYDLLSYPKFESLDLIESHTGLLKKRNLWYSKFQGDGLEHIPFSERMLKVFGDQHLFHPIAYKARNMVIELGLQKRWNWTTTDAKVLQDLGSLTDHLLADAIKHI